MTLTRNRLYALIGAFALSFAQVEARAQMILPENNSLPVSKVAAVNGGTGGGTGGSAARPSDQFTLSEEVLGSHLYHVGKEVINAPASVIFAHITDYADAGRLFSNLKNCKVLSEDRGTKIVHFSLRGVANLFNLDYTLAIKESAPANGVGTIEWHRLAGAFKANEGSWKLEPVDGGRKTMVTYTKYIDGGLIPQSLVNRELDQTIPQIMANLKRISEAG